MAFLVGNFGKDFMPDSVIMALNSDTVPVYGVRFDGTNSVGVRTYDASQLVWERSSNLVAGRDDFASIAPFNIKECITQYNSGTGKREVLAYKGASNWDSLVASKTGDRMIEYPCFWYKRLSKYDYLVAPQAKVGFKPAPMFYRNGVLYDKVRVTKFALNSSYESQVGYSPLVSTDMNTFRTNLRAKGMHLLDSPTWWSLVFLMTVKYANLNVQTTVGYGRSDGNATIVSGGTENVLGVDGSATSVGTNESVLTLGIENFFSNVWKYLDGIYGYGGHLYIKDIESITSDPTSANELTSTYDMVSTAYPTNGSNTAISDIAFDSGYDWMQFPTAGGSPNPTGDAFWSNGNFSCVVAGGSVWDGSSCGLWSFSVLSSVGGVGANYGALGLEF